MVDSFGPRGRKRRPRNRVTDPVTDTDTADEVVMDEKDAGPTEAYTESGIDLEPHVVDAETVNLDEGEAEVTSPMPKIVDAETVQLDAVQGGAPEAQAEAEAGATSSEPTSDEVVDAETGASVQIPAADGSAAEAGAADGGDAGAETQEILTNVTVVPHQSPKAAEPGAIPVPPTETEVSVGRKGRIRGRMSPELAAAEAAAAGAGAGAATTRLPAATGAAPGRAGRRRRRRARLRVSSVDPWSVMRMSLLFSVATAIILFVSVSLLWGVLASSGALETLQEMLDSVVGSSDGGALQLSRFLDTKRVLGFTALISVLNVVLMTAIATLVSLLYNLAAAIFGGFEITLSED